jgi:hypothetical protein
MISMNHGNTASGEEGIIHGYLGFSIDLIRNLTNKVLLHLLPRSAMVEVVPTVIGESRRIGYAHYGRRPLKYYEVALLYSKYSRSPESEDG